MADPTLLGLDNEEEEEEDEPIPDLYGELPPASPPQATTHDEEEQYAGMDDDNEPLAIQEPDTKKARISERQSMNKAELEEALTQAEDRIEAFQKREAEYLKSITAKDKEILELRGYLQDIVGLQSPAETWARKTLLDPSIALEFRLLHDKLTVLEASEKKLKQDVKAVQFSVESATGQALAAQTMKLQAENKDLAGRLESVRQLEDDKAYMKAEKDRLEKELAQRDGQIDQLEEDRGLFVTMIYTLKKQLAAYQQQGAEAEAAEATVSGEGGGEEQEEEDQKPLKAEGMDVVEEAAAGEGGGGGEEEAAN